jgi:hypothetical protein
MDLWLRNELVQHLGGLVSDISERGSCAGWHSGCEDMIPFLCRKVVESGKPEMYGACTIDLELARRLCGIADFLGCWVDLSNHDNGFEYMPYQPITF